MAWLPMYLIEQDLTLLNDWLNREPELAFLVSNGPDRWIAKETHNIFADIGKQKFGPGGEFARPDYAEYVLWHIPSGPLPLLKGGNGPIAMRFDKEDWQHDAHIEDPWSGWAEIRGEAISRMPYFGAGHPGIIQNELAQNPLSGDVFIFLK